MLTHSSRFCTLIFFISFHTLCHSQSIALKDQLLGISEKVDAFSHSVPTEKLYLQFDKPYYSLDDTIWFKVYLFNGSYFTPSKKSGIVYIELANDSNKVVKRMMLPVANSLSWGNIALDPKDIPEGNYILRAYTNWMRNFGEDYVFTRSFYLGNPSEKQWLVNTRLNLVKGNLVDTARLYIQLNKMNMEPLTLKEINLEVANGKKIWYKKNVVTKIGGDVDVSFALKGSAKHLMIIAKGINNGGEDNKLMVPITVNRLETMDLQFMPEGGNLVAGLPAHVAFKAVDIDGKAVTTQGNVYDSKQRIVAYFKSAHNGMGAFDLIPEPGETYTAKIKLPTGPEKTFGLPAVKSIGTILKIKEVAGSDSLAITIMATQPNGSYYLVGQSRGIVCYGAVVNVINNAVKSKISTVGFPTGIGRFTLLNTAMQPVNERIFFINHHDALQIDVQADKLFYNCRDSIALNIHVTDKLGNAVRGAFSLAVTDNTQVRSDSSTNMLSNLLLTSDLKGNVEDPAYYFGANTDGSISQQLDNLLLTQGWVGYDWKEIFNPTKPILYKPENDFVIRGRVTNAFNKPVANTHVTLFSKKPSFVIDSVTGKDGHFEFTNIVPLDTPMYFIQARNKNGRSSNINVGVEEFRPPVFRATAEYSKPWYVNADTTLIDYVKKTISVKNEKEKVAGGGQVLKEVVISAKKFVKGSQNLNGPGNADLVIDEKELEKAGKKTLLQLLQEKIPGFKEQYLQLSGSVTSEKIRINQILAKFIIDADINPPLTKDEEWYYINGKPVKFIIDGISLYRVITMSPPAITNINDYLNSRTAEDIVGIEVNSSTKYASRYLPMEWGMAISSSAIAFIEITTRSGGGPGVIKTLGTYLYKPLSFTLPKQFYVPKYNGKNKTIAAKDYRSTIYWKPDLTTDEDGNASVSFYAADLTGSYTILVEGTDWDNGIGSNRFTLKVKQ